MRGAAAHPASCRRLLQRIAAVDIHQHLLYTQAIAAIVAPVSSALRQAGERVRTAIQTSSLVSPSAAAEGAQPPEYIKRMRAMFH